MPKVDCLFLHKNNCYLGWILLVLQCICFLPIKGQTTNETLKEKSDYLFASGVEKYQSKKFVEAIPLFRECAKIDSIIGESNNRQGYASMWLASCYFNLGDIETAASLSIYYMINPIDRRLTVKSDSIADILSPILFQYGDAGKALPLIQEVLRLEIEELGEQSVWVGNTYGQYGYAQLLSGHTDEAINAYEHGLSIIAASCGEKSEPYAFSLCDVICAYYSAGDYNSAYNKALLLLDIYNTLALDNTNIYYIAISACGGCLIKFGKYEESIHYLLESLEILAKMNLENSLDYGICLGELGEAQLMTGDSRKAKETLEKSYSLFVHSSEPYDKRDLIQCLNILSQANYVLGDTITAINLAKKAIALFEDEGIEKCYLYPELYFDLWNIYEALKEPKEAHIFAEKAIEYYRTLDCKDMNYANLLYRYSGCVANDNRFQYGIELASEALSFMENTPNVPDSILGMYRCQLARRYSDIGEMDSAFYYAQKALQDIKSNNPSNSKNYFILLPQIASIYWMYGEREEALILYQEALAHVEKSYPDSESHLDILKNYANICFLSGLYTKAMDFQKDAVRLTELLYGKESSAYSEATSDLLRYSDNTSDQLEKRRMISQNDIESSNNSEMVIQNVRQQALLAVQQGNIAKSHSLIEDAYHSIFKDSISISMDFYNLLITEAELNNYIGRPADALSSLNAAYTIATSLFGKEKIDKYYYQYWYLLGMTNLNMKKWDEAETALTKCMSSAKTLFGENHMEYLASQVAIATIKSLNDDTEGAAQIMSSLFNALRDQIFTHFATMSSSERSAFWSKVSVVFNSLMPFLAYDSKNSIYYGDGFNALLLSKGLLLSTEQEVAQLLINSKDEKGLELYNKLLTMRQKLNSLNIYSPSESLTEADSLREVIRHGERELIARSSAYGDYTQNLQYSWQDVKLSLKKNDVAIEFADFFDKDGNNLYVAFILKKDMETPQIVHLFDYADYSSLDSYKYYNTSSLYDLVWKPLEPYFSKDSRIFFSPQGVLHSLAIESLPSSNGICMSNRYKVYRLSSTRELCIDNSANRKKSAVLYGDIDYDADNEPNSDSGSYDEKRFSNNGIEEMANVRGAIKGELPPLPGTKQEVNSIARSFAHAKRPACLYQNELATESSIKSISSSEHTIIHIATHGYYLSSNEPQESVLSTLIKQSISSNLEDLTLLRSGLFFAGANTTLSGDQIKNPENDGILTAKEVAAIDLHTFEMVSLSACQTGLGVVSGDGVFGIQRGFKKAGVKSLLMSLWNVDDRATCALMTEFYKFWLSGLSKYDALESAKTEIKKVKGWEDPRYWAAFILLDGIN